MQLNSLSLTNFRNYQQFQLDFSPMTVFVGPNGIGKTNLLEAIYLLATFSSYRTHSNKDLINREETFCRIIGNIDKKNVEIFMDLQNPARKIKVNGVSKKAVEALGNLKVVLFSPESLEIVYGGPSQRRRFMNLILSQIDSNYARALISLNRVLANRNHLLQRIKNQLAKVDELEFWDQQLYKINKTIVASRYELINVINKKLADYYQVISDNSDQLNLKYWVKSEPEDLLETFCLNRNQEIRHCVTLYGPHRDELVITLNNQLIGAGWSRGELRSACLALKMSELDFHKNISGQNAVLLLDDVFSELDKNRRSKLLKLVANQQTIITTTDIDHLDRSIIKRAKVVELK